MHKVIKGQTLLCCLLLLLGCSNDKHWKVDSISTGNTAFDSTRIRFIEPSKYTPIAFEMIMIGGEIQAYLSFNRSQVKTKKESNCTKVVFRIGSDSIEEMIPLYKGGMRLRIPHEITEQLIEALQNGERVRIDINGLEQTLQPEQFSQSFSELVEKKSFFQNLIKGPIQ